MVNFVKMMFSFCKNRNTFVTVSKGVLFQKKTESPTKEIRSSPNYFIAFTKYSVAAMGFVIALPITKA